MAKERVQVDIVTNVGEAVKGFATLVAGLHIAQKAFGMLKEAALNTLKIHAEFEQLETSLRVLTGSAAQAKLVFTELKQFAASTPFALNDLATGAKNLIAFGINAEDVTDKMRNLGNASGGNVSTLNRLVDAYGKLMAKGKASLQELNQFTSAGVPIMEALRDQLGMTKEELSDYISAGKVGFADVDAALTKLTTGEGKFAGMLEEQSKTLTGLMSTLKDNINLGAVAMTENMLPAIKSVVSWMNEAVARGNLIRDIARTMREGALVLDPEGSFESNLASIKKRMDDLNVVAKEYNEQIAKGTGLVEQLSAALLRQTYRNAEIARMKREIEAVNQELKVWEIHYARMISHQKLSAKERADNAEKERLELERLNAVAVKMTRTWDAMTEAEKKLYPVEKTRVDLFQESIDALAAMRKELYAMGKTRAELAELHNYIDKLVAGRDFEIQLLADAEAMAKSADAAAQLSDALREIEDGYAKMVDAGAKRAAAEAEIIERNLAMWQEYFEKKAAMRQVEIANEKAEADAMVQHWSSVVDQYQTYADTALRVFGAFGHMMVDMESGAEALKEAIKDALAATMEAMSKELAVMAIKALWEGITYANPTLVAAGAAYGSASALAAAGAGAIRALGEGGVVTRPTHALIGERGPEAVIPLNRASMGGGDINLMVVVNGSLIHEDDLNARIMQGVRMVTRGH